MSRPTTVLRGRDNEVIPLLIDIHAPNSNPRILDVTYNTGKMWKGLDFEVISMDIDPQFHTDLVGDFTAIPIKNRSIDVLVFDPPHIPASSVTENASRIWATIYGVHEHSPVGQSDTNISGIFVPFLQEAQRVLTPDGIILAKISDLVHNHRHQWQHIDFINAVQAIGMTACDMLIKIDPSAGHLTSSKWKTVYHLRNGHVYWIVVRNGNHCERPR